MDFRLSFHLNPGLSRHLTESHTANLQKRASESLLRHSVPGTEFATSVLNTSCIFVVHFPILLLKLEDMIS